jgi:L,D-peptidoglycan transpeptidase YkuD (ErfK/YbiS/YcfS/YnhG family)
MNCLYCQALIDNPKIPSTLCCLHCRTLFYFKNNELSKAIIMLEYHECEYWIELNYNSNQTIIRSPMRQVDKPYDPSNTQMWRITHQFNHIIKISPSNALDKLKTIINFS